MRLRTLPLLATALLFASTASAYVQPLHREITEYAFTQATQDADFLSRYNLAYLADLLKADMSYGADHEDDLPRSLYHFLDPQNGDTGLTIPVSWTPPLDPQCGPVPFGADVWALDTPAPDPGNDASMFANGYGLADAHNRMYAMLAGATPGDRSLAAERLFEDLGHMVHLVQDMGQPEHTRNDQHLVLGSYGLTGLPIKQAASIYENWTRDHIAGLNIVRAPTSSFVDVPADFFFTGYPSLRFADYHSYFTNGSAGLADYASTNHVTQDTNYNDKSFHCLAHPTPDRGNAVPRDETFIVTTTNPVTLLPEQQPITESVYTLSFYDYATGQPNRDGYHTIESFFNHEIGAYTTDVTNKVFSLSDESWFTRAANLLPKAVGYSAGLIQRFFRGRIATSWYATPNGNYSVHVSNTTPLAYANVLTNCTVELYKTLDTGDLQLLAPAATLPSCQNDAIVATGIPSTDADPLYTHELRAVVRGTLGGETDAVVGQILPKKHTLKLVYQYNPNIAFSENWLQLSTYDWSETSMDGWFTCTTRCIGTTVYSGGNLEFSTALQPPFNGTLSITAGVSDTDVFNGGVFLYPLNDFVTPESATLTVYRDGQQVNQLTIKSPKSNYGYLMYFEIDGLGNVSHWIDETNIRGPVRTE